MECSFHYPTNMLIEVAEGCERPKANLKTRSCYKSSNE